MGLSSSIQFRDIHSVIEAFESRKADAWSISQGKQFMFRGIGVDTLETHLQSLFNSDSSATYTLRVYDDIEDEKKIKPSTVEDGSFNFKFNEELRETFRQVRGYGVGYAPNNNRDESMLNALAKKIDDLTAKVSEMEQPESDDSLGMIGKILDHPVIAGIAPGIISTIVDALTGKKTPQGQMMPQISQNVNRAVLSGIDDDAIIREAILKLKQYDKDIAVHLQKLAALAETDTDTFKMLINYFN